ncbi:hypothetical protein [Ferruginibacter sp. SUN106]|uniref:hypothetical protein n=1 Tax=Ferruginibacter sp. SUN106 TaxID=2978348 RepID=UPI003D36FC6A
MKYLVVIVALVLFSVNVLAQKKNTIVFNSYNAIGFVAGKSPVALVAQTENGIKIKSWFIGAGIGIDNYYKKTIPLFGAVKKEFVLKSNSLFLYANIGGNIIAADKEIKKTFSTISTTGGFYLDAGVGYKIKITKGSSIFFTLGNSLKNMKETETSTDSGFPYYYTTKRNLSRIAVKAGFQF